LIRKTEKLEKFIGKKLSETAIKNIGQTHPDLLSRAAAFLLFKDSKVSYTIEGENPPHNRIERWGSAIGKAGKRKISVLELEYLQQIVIEDNRFITPGLRKKGGFVGEHDRTTGMPMPDHISACANDLNTLLSGLIDTYELLYKDDFDAVILITLKLTSLPASFFYPRNHTLPSKLPKTNSTKFKVTHVSSRSTTKTAAVFISGRKFYFFLLPLPFFNFSCSCHSTS